MLTIWKENHSLKTFKTNVFLVDLPIVRAKCIDFGFFLNQTLTKLPSNATEVVVISISQLGTSFVCFALKNVGFF